MNEALIHTKAIDNINGFIYRKTYEIAQELGVGPQCDSVEEFYMAISKDEQTMETISNAIAPLITAETGLPLPVTKRLIKYAIKSTGRDAKSTFKRIARRKKKQEGQLTNALAESTLFQQIVNESIKEGGNAIPSAKDVRGDIAGEIAKDVINAISSTFGCEAEPAGSTGKKGREMYSGDIDILMDMPWEKNEEVAQWVKENFPSCEMVVQPGFKQISFGYPYDEEGTPKIAQVDLMFTSNMNWRRWSAYSPSPYESKFKGLVQTVLLKLIARSKPIDKEKFPDEFYTAEDYGGGYEGVMKSHWRYMWDAEIGLVIVHRTNLGKKRPIKSYTIKEDTIIVTSNPDEAMKLILGPDATLDDMRSPETMVAFLFSGKYEYATPEILQRIHDGVVANKELAKAPGVLENFEALWNEYAGKEEEPQGEPAYSAAIQEMRDLYRRMKKTEE